MCPCSQCLTTTNQGSVGLKVTSLRWIGPEPEGSDPLPQIPAEIEYKDAVPRAEDIGFEDEEGKLQASQNEGISPLPILGLSLTLMCLTVGSSQEATQDVAERERLQLMMPVSHLSLCARVELIKAVPGSRFSRFWFDIHAACQAIADLGTRRCKSNKPRAEIYASERKGY